MTIPPARCFLGSSSGAVVLALLLMGCGAAPPPPPLPSPPPPPSPQKKVSSPGARPPQAPSRPLVVKRPKQPPVLALQPLSGVKALALGGRLSCALLDGGRVACWGDNSRGQIHGSDEGKVTTPRFVAGVSGAQRIAASHDFACALRDGEVLSCWGTMPRVFGRGVHTFGVENADTLVAGRHHVDALRRDGEVWCLGSAHACGIAQDGVTSGSDKAGPQLRPGLDDVEQLSSYVYKGCAKLRDQTVQCWGMGSRSPTPVPQLRGVETVEVRSAYSCALGGDQLVYCRSKSKWLPDATPLWGSPQLRPMGGLSGVVQLALGTAHLCALSTDGEVYCLGNNRHGQLSGFEQSPKARPAQRVEGIDDAVAIAAGEMHTCALLRDETVRCWGSNNHGQLGTPLGEPSYKPTFVVAATEPAHLTQAARSDLGDTDNH